MGFTASPNRVCRPINATIPGFLLDRGWLNPGRHPYFTFASRRSLARRSSYSSLVISPAAYLLFRSCRGDCISR